MQKTTRLHWKWSVLARVGALGVGALVLAGCATESVYVPPSTSGAGGYYTSSSNDYAQTDGQGYYESAYAAPGYYGGTGYGPTFTFSLGISNYGVYPGLWGFGGWPAAWYTAPWYTSNLPLFYGCVTCGHYLHRHHYALGRHHRGVHGRFVPRRRYYHRTSNHFVRHLRYRQGRQPPPVMHHLVHTHAHSVPPMVRRTTTPFVYHHRRNSASFGRHGWGRGHPPRFHRALPARRTAPTFPRRPAMSRPSPRLRAAPVRAIPVARPRGVASKLRRR